MAPTQTRELSQFREFIAKKIAEGEQSISPEEALEEWRALNPTTEELAESVAAVRQALADMEAGDTGEPLDDLLAEIRARHGLHE
jgi:hypothetical protein